MSCDAGRRPRACRAGLGVVGVLLAFAGCAATRTGQVATDLAQCRNAFDVRVSLELGGDGRPQLRSSHPCPDRVIELGGVRDAGDVHVRAPGRGATDWISLHGAEALRPDGRAPLWNRNTLEVWVQSGPGVRPASPPGPGFRLFAYRHAEGGPVLRLVAPTGEVVAEERLGAGVLARAGAYTGAAFLDLLTLPFVPFVILVEAIGG